MTSWENHHFLLGDTSWYLYIFINGWVFHCHVSLPGCILLTLFLLHVTRWQPSICSRRLLDYSIYLMCLWITIAAPGPFVRDALCSSGNTKRIRLPPAALRGSPAILLNLSILAPRKGSRCWFPSSKTVWIIFNFAQLFQQSFPPNLKKNSFWGRVSLLEIFPEQIFQGWNSPQKPSKVGILPPPPFSDDTRWEEKFFSVPTGLIEPTSRPICLAWKLRGYGIVKLFGVRKLGQKPWNVPLKWEDFWGSNTFRETVWLRRHFFWGGEGSSDSKTSFHGLNFRTASGGASWLVGLQPYLRWKNHGLQGQSCWRSVIRGGYGRLKGNQDVLNVGIRLSRDKKPFQGVQS